MDSFLENCLDHHLISRWICIDDASSIEDRQLMAERYPFFEFIYKDNDEVGHAKSMNRLLAEVTTKYWLHFEDDWQVVKPGNYISHAMAVLNDNDALIQCVLNRNYAEILDNYNIVGGHLVVSQDQKTVYRIHDYINPASPHFQDLLSANPGRLTNAYWPGFSLMPSLIRRQAFDDLGSFNPGAGHFERDMADRALKKRWLTACIDDLTMLNIGRLRIETNPDGPLNAYQLLGVDQFAHFQDITVGIVANWTDGNNVVRQWQQQFPNNGAWKGVRLATSDVVASPDVTLVVNHPRSNDQKIENQQSIVVHMEPLEGTSLYGDWANPDPAKFMHVHSRNFVPNFLEWHLEATYDQLITSSPDKKRDLSAIVTGKRLSTGHHLRLDLMHLLEFLALTTMSLFIIIEDHCHCSTSVTGCSRIATQSPLKTILKSTTSLRNLLMRFFRNVSPSIGDVPILKTSLSQIHISVCLLTILKLPQVSSKKPSPTMSIRSDCRLFGVAKKRFSTLCNSLPQFHDLFEGTNF
jgi:hypothetical protein